MSSLSSLSPVTRSTESAFMSEPSGSCQLYDCATRQEGLYIEIVDDLVSSQRRVSRRLCSPRFPRFSTEPDFHMAVCNDRAGPTLYAKQ